MAALLIPGLVFFSALVLVALANTANVHTKAANEANVGFLAFLREVVNPKTYVHAATQLTRAAVSRWALAQLKPITAWFVALNALVLNVFRTQTAVTEGTATALERIRGHTIPRAVGRGVAPVKAQTKAASKTAHTALGKANTTSTSLHNYRVATRPKIAHATHAVDVAIPQQLGRIRTRTNTLERGQTNLRERTKALEDGALDTWKWIRSHPLSAVTGVFTGAVAIALSRLGFGFARCRSWQRLGRSLTCREADNLGALLGLVGTFAVVSEFRELVKIAQAVEHETAVGIKDLAGL